MWILYDLILFVIYVQEIIICPSAFKAIILLNPLWNKFHLWEISTGKIIHIPTFTISIGGAIQIFLGLTIKGLPALHLIPITQEQAIPRGDITNHDAKIISTYAKVRAKHAKDGLIHTKDWLDTLKSLNIHQELGYSNWTACYHSLRADNEDFAKQYHSKSIKKMSMLFHWEVEEK